MDKAELYTDEDGDLYVVFRGEDNVRERITRTSCYGESWTPGERRYEKPDDSLCKMMLGEIPADLARLYVEHGCNVAEYELDRAIWAAAYARFYIEWLQGEHGPHTLDVVVRISRDSADDVVRARWLAKGGAA